MKIAIYGDIHENFHNLRLALNVMRERKVDCALCLGDFINPGIVAEIIKFGIKTYAVWGNNDGEKSTIMRFILASNGVMEISDTTFAQHEFDGKKVFMSHHPDFAPSLARSNDFAAVFFGHDHVHYVERMENGCWLANPGEISTHKTGRLTFLIWDTVTNEVTTEEISNGMNVNS